jgi:tetratricopeptide (TPR) repeat protein
MPRTIGRSFAHVVALCLTTSALTALPAPVAVAQAQTQAASVAAGLAAQYEATLIRERRLADDRETRLLEEAEARLRQARLRADARVAGAESALTQARSEYAALCAQVTSREASLHAEIEAYRAEALGIATRATPERLAALQRFADGDRVGAWPVIEELMQASVRARMAAAAGAAAGEVREVASLRAIMRANGEATSVQVLQLWDQAASLDPRHQDTQLERAVLLLDLGQLPQARAAAESALAQASNDGDRARANTELGRVAMVAGDLARAKSAFEAQLPWLRQRAVAEPTGDNRRDLVVALNNLGDVLGRQGDPNAAYRAYHEALGLTLQLAREEPNSQLQQIDITISNDRIGDLFYAHGMYDRAGPIFQENLDFRRSLLARTPNDRERKLAVAASLERMGDVRAVANNHAAARALFEESLAIRQQLSASDPSSVVLQGDVARTTNMVGDTYRNAGDLSAARQRYAESLETRRRLASADPSNAELARDVGISLQRVGMVEQMDNKNTEARAAWTEARGVFAGLAQRDPSNAAFVQLRDNTDELLRRLGTN